MNITEADRDPWVVLHLAGELDMATSPRLRQDVVALVAKGRRFLVVDLTEVDFVDSTGLGVLVGAMKRVRVHDGELHVVVASDRLRQLFEVTRLVRAFALFESVEEAIGVRVGEP